MFEDLVSRIDYFTKDNSWTNQKHSYFTWGKCEHAGHRGSNENIKLEYSHRDHKHENYEDDIEGAGRGKNKRVLNFIKHPERYYLLCPECHQEYDNRAQKKAPDSFPINLDTEKRDHLNQMKVKRDKKLLSKEQLSYNGGIKQ